MQRITLTPAAATITLSFEAKAAIVNAFLIEITVIAVN
jgi:hypothetical protein